MKDRGLPVLTYHALDTSGSVVSTDPGWFRQTMKAFHDEGFRSVDLEEWILAGRPVINRGFAITFDDGLASILGAADVIARYGFTATAFLVTGRMGTDNQWVGQSKAVPRSKLLTWEEAERLREAGFRFAAHSVNHPVLDDCDDARLDAELAGSRQAIEDRLGPCRLVAHPYGRANHRVRIAASRHFIAGFGTRLDFATSDQEIMALSRIDGYYLQRPKVLDRLISGRASRWLAARRVARAVRRTIRLA